MRPLRLELTGFTSFRDTTVIDFEGADYFALVGPTGSGKSTVIDAICFALYGSVPRYDRQGLVHPVITQGKIEARVRLDFSFGGRAYSAVRVVKRTGKGATTRDATLQCAGEVIAKNADEMTAEVTRLLGLTFDHFTKCVVLPQGEFARFLHDNPKNRQGLLVKLLNLGLYESMRQNANLKAAEAKNRAAVAEQRLEQDLGFATAERLEEAKGKVVRLRALRDEIAGATPRLLEFDEAITKATCAEKETKRWLRLIADLRMPEEVEVLADLIEAAQKLLEEAETSFEEAGVALEEAAATRKELPEKSEITGSIKAQQKRTSLDARLATEAQALTALQKEAAATGKAWEVAKKAASAATVNLREAENQHKAQHLAELLKEGEPCPVCLQAVAVLPDHRSGHDLGKMRSLVARAEADADAVATKRQKAAAKVTQAEATVALLQEQLHDVDETLGVDRDLDELQDALLRVERAEKALERAQAHEKTLRRGVGAARKEVTSLRSNEASARKGFEDARDDLVPLKPPPAKRAGLAEDWVELITWAEKLVPALQEEEEKAAEAAAVARGSKDELLEAINASCLECELDISKGDPAEAAVTAHAHAVQEEKRIREGIAAKKKLSKELQQAKAEQDLAHALGEHLSAKAGRFESWIVNTALQRLAAGASSILKDLTSGQYAMTIDGDGNFLVTDRHNADETRSAKTLSGGETFLASLSLALALSDQLVELAAEGAAHLEAIFLDEGFGTLDPETLETVAATVENLAAGGRMVGVITHVRELAERIPIQFRVSKDTRTSTIEKVSA